MKQPSVKKYLLSLLMAALLIIGLAVPILPMLGATTADVTLTATFAFVGITDNQTSYDFGVVAASSSTNTSTTQVALTNTSTVQTDMTIAVTGATWTGGTAWTHSDTATAGVDTVGLRAGRATVADVIVKNTSPNYIYENCPASTNFTYGLQLLAPTSGTDGVQKTNTLRVTAAQG
jgi:hypothetical protein